MHTLGGPPQVIPQILFSALKIAALAVIAPFLLVAILAAFSCVVVDFTWFRAHEILEGNPHPKGLWEF